MARRPRKRVAKRRVARRPTRPTRQESLAAQPPVRRCSNLPTQLTTFIGREREIAEVKRLLGTTRLLTLTGSGGCGKTRLALEVAADVIGDYQDGVWFAEFVSIGESILVPKTVASALSVPEQPGRALVDTLVDILQPKALLLILDNCEHLLTACRQLALSLLRTCPQVRILATSREGLGVPGEIVWCVPSLAAPQGSTSIGEMILYDAVRLFAERAATSASGFTISGQNAASVARICHRLDGIPLAIELAAARVKVLAVDQIATRLDDRLQFLAASSQALDPRHQTLRAAIDWSYNLLLDKERVLFRRLSVFAGGFALDAVEGICAGGTVETADILDLLTSLVNKSLLLVETHGAEARYRLLETIRQYARDRLVEAEEETAVRNRHRAWYVVLAERANREPRGPRQRIWREHDNLRAALVWSKESADGTEVMLRLVGALVWFWWMHGNLTEARSWIEDALARRLDVSRSVLPAVYWGAAHFAWRSGDYEQSRTYAGEGLAIAHEFGDVSNGAFLQSCLGIVAYRQMRYEDAATHMEEAVRLARRGGDNWRISVCLSQEGILARFRGDLVRAEALHTEALTLAEDMGDPAIVSYTLRCLGFVANQRGDYRRAVETFRESLRLSLEPKLHGTILDCLWGLAGAFSVLRRDDEATRLFAAAETFRKAIGHIPAPQDRQYYDACLAATRRRLRSATYTAAWTAGLSMSLEEAAEYALRSPELAQQIGRRVRARSHDGGPLTAREREVVRLIARGLTNRQIAGTLAVSARTADAHIQNILNKLGFGSRAQIAAWAVEQHLMSTEETMPISGDAGSPHNRRPT